MKSTRRPMLAAILAFSLSLSAYGYDRYSAPLADGTYAGTGEYTQYGWVQVALVVSNGTVSGVKVLQYPNDMGTSRHINRIALPRLIQEVVRAQTPRIHFVSGATVTSEAFVRSVTSAFAAAEGR